MRRPERNALLWLLGLACLCALAALRWPQQNWLAVDFQALLPDQEVNPWVSIANEQAGQDYGGILVWQIEGGDAQQVGAFAAGLRIQLETAGYADPDFAEHQLASWQQLTATLLEHRRGLLSTADQQLLQRDPDAYFTRARQMLYSPLGGFALSFLEADASGLFANFLNDISPAQSPERGDVAGIFSELVLVNVPSDQLGFTRLPGLYQLYQSLQQQADQQQLALYANGAPLYSAYGVQSAQREMSTIGLASLVLLVILLLLSLRSISAIVLTTTCIGVGVAVGLLVTVSVFQQIHVLTLVFGASLIGIAADYALHYLAHSRCADWRPNTALSRVFGALRLSALTSVIAFATLLFLPFPGIRQIGLFMASGLLASFLTVCLLFPALYRGLRHPSPLTGIWSRRQWFWPGGGPVLVVLMLVAAIGVARLPAIDDVRTFYAAPPVLADAHEKITARQAQLPDSRYLLLEAADPAQLLDLEEQLGTGLRHLQHGGVLAQFNGIGTLIPPPQRQEEAARLLAGEPYVRALRQHMTLIGLDEQLQEAQLDALRRPFTPLQIENLDDLHLPPGQGGFLGCDARGCASRIRLSGVADIAAIMALTERHAGVALIDQIATINAGMGVYRQAVAALLALAAVLIGAVLTLLYGWRMAGGILLAPLATCLFSLLVVGFLQGGLSLINMMALLLLIGVSLDYAIFRAFTAAGEQAATTLAISLSAATSVLAFGILGFSDTPVIRSFGQTIAVGLCFAWLFSWFRLSPGKSS